MSRTGRFGKPSAASAAAAGAGPQKIPIAARAVTIVFNRIFFVLLEFFAVLDPGVAGIATGAARA
jgi:hypothetical protein